MRAMIVLTFDVGEATDDDLEKLAEALTKIDPPSLPMFDGQARISIGPPVDEVLTYLDEEEGR